MLAAANGKIRMTRKDRQPEQSEAAERAGREPCNPPYHPGFFYYQPRSFFATTFAGEPRLKSSRSQKKKARFSWEMRASVVSGPLPSPHPVRGTNPTSRPRLHRKHG